MYHLEAQRAYLLKEVAIVIADNVLCPGASEFLWYKDFISSLVSNFIKIGSCFAGVSLTDMGRPRVSYRSWVHCKFVGLSDHVEHAFLVSLLDYISYWSLA